jgi:hypothetical protein
LVHQSINEVVRNPTVSDIYEKKRGNKKTRKLDKKNKQRKKNTWDTRVSSNSEGGKRNTARGRYSLNVWAN